MADQQNKTTSTGGLSALFNRPKTEFVAKQGEDISISPQPSDLIYIRKCNQCKFRVHKKAAKCIIESCSDVRVELEDFLISGTLVRKKPVLLWCSTPNIPMQEMIDCTSVTISINPQDPLPTVSAERSSDIHVYYYDPRAFGSLFTVDCTNVFIHFQPPHREEYKLDLPSEKLDQFVTEMRDSKMIISKVIREGCGHATTVEKHKIAMKKEEQMQRQVESYLTKLITIKPKSSVAPEAKPHIQAAPPQEKPQPEQNTEPAKPSDH
ncbi:uncharacterized protein LOC135339116 isoform X1 [Halichondria panicea]|uniref:uncharacterized protein LOC135339116 isoform X1 n=1 Tax=Halichondria panicea TaxID=6063 RepID=UPI00312B5916